MADIWQRLLSAPTYVLRNIGAEILVFVLVTLWCGLRPEPRKAIIKKSISIALSRCWIHLLPLTVSLILLWLNIKGFYIPNTLSQDSATDITDQSNSVVLALIQVAAKVQVRSSAKFISTANQNTQELLIIASVSTVLFQIIRDELLHDGIPLGLATSALSFSRLSYFWSPAFWGGTTSLVNLKKWRGVRVLGLITLGGFIAITAGPASAVLMLPRPTNWHEFTTKFWLNGTADVYWPTKLTSDHTGGPHCTGLEGMNTMNQPQCINKGLPFLESFYAYSRTGARYEVFTPENSWPRVLQAVPRGESAESWSVAPHATTSLVQGYLWYDPHWFPLSLRPRGVRYAHTPSRASAVRTVCNREVLNISNATYNVSLPVVPAYGLWAQEDGHPGPFADIKLAKPLWGTNKDSLTDLTSLTTVWIPADMDSVTAGLVVLGELHSELDIYRLGVVCSIDARWNRAMHTYTASSVSGIGESGAFISVSQNGRRSNEEIKKRPLPIDNGDWSHIAAEAEWLETLTPVVPIRMRPSSYMNATSMTTALANLYHAANIYVRSRHESGWDVAQIELITSTAMADAISRVGLAQAWDTEILYSSFGQTCSDIDWGHGKQFCPAPPPSGEFSSLEFHGFLTGKHGTLSIESNSFVSANKKPTGQAMPTKPPGLPTTCRSPCSSCT